MSSYPIDGSQNWASPEFDLPVTVEEAIRDFVQTFLIVFTSGVYLYVGWQLGQLLFG